METIPSNHHVRRPWCAEQPFPSDACVTGDRAPTHRLSPTQQALQSHEIRALKREVLEQRRLIDMLLVLVDPEDVKAALELKRILPPTATQLAGLGRGQPPGLDDDMDDERPW